jgi:hypothetical protein
MASDWGIQKTRVKKSSSIFVVLVLGMWFWSRCPQKFWTQTLTCIILFLLTFFPLMFFHGETPAYKNENKERRPFVANEDFCSIGSCQVRISTIFKYLEFLAAFQKPLTVFFGTIGFCRTLVQQHCCRMWVTKINQSCAMCLWGVCNFCCDSLPVLRVRMCMLLKMHKGKQVQFRHHAHAAVLLKVKCYAFPNNKATMWCLCGYSLSFLVWWPLVINYWIWMHEILNGVRL